MVDRADRMLDWQYMIHAIERTEPMHPPGARTGYHGLTFGYLVGEILQRVSGKSFTELVRAELVEPLGLDGMYVGAPDEELYRAAELIWPKRSVLQPVLPKGLARRIVRTSAPAIDLSARAFGMQLDIQSILDSLAPRGIGSFDFSASRTLRASIPAANGLFTARSLARMYACLAGGGEIDGVRLLSRRTLRRAVRRQKRADGLAVIPFDMRWRLGYHGVFTSQGSPRNAFGHFGFGGSGGWADPSRDLAVSLIVNSGLGTPFGDMRIARISAEVLTAADARPRVARKRGARSTASGSGSGSEAVVKPVKRRRQRRAPPIAPVSI
jgi:CubicO group peptidase (beta-lactamase class C family)